MKNISKNLLLLISLYFFSSNQFLFAQKIEVKTILFDNILCEYLIIGDTTYAKPLFVFCMGSLPIPIFESNNGIISHSNLPFDYKKLASQYKILVVSKIGIPAIAEQNSLNKQYEYIDSSNNVPLLFIKNNSLYKQSELHKLILKRIIKENVLKEKIIVVGHSAGSRIATKLAVTCNYVTHLAYLCSEPMGRYYEIIRDSKNNDDSLLMKNIDRWKKIVHNRRSNIAQLGSYDTDETWFSYSENLMDDLLSLKIPIYAAYPTLDTKSEGMVIIPYLFYAENKSNLTFDVFYGLEHNFFEIDKTGVINYDRSHFQDIIEKIVSWAQSTSSR